MLNDKIFLGQFVVSKQGRDKNQVYIVVNIIDDLFVEVVNGTTKKLIKPKKKNINHLHFTPFGCEEIKNKLYSKQKINDQMVYRALHEYSKKNKEATNGC